MGAVPYYYCRYGSSDRLIGRGIGWRHVGRVRTVQGRSSVCLVCCASMGWRLSRLWAGVWLFDWMIWDIWWYECSNAKGVSMSSAISVFTGQGSVRG